MTRYFGFIKWVDNVNWPPKRDSEADEGLTLETSVSESLYVGQFTLVYTHSVILVF